MTLNPNPLSAALLITALTVLHQSSLAETPDSPAAWRQYKDPRGEFTLRYPYELLEAAADSGPARLLLRSRGRGFPTVNVVSAPAPYDFGAPP